MPVIWSVEAESPVAMVRYVEPVTFAEWREAIDGLLQSPASDVRIGWLVDRRAASVPSLGFAQEVSWYVTGHHASFTGRRIAFLVTAGDAAYGMARMQEALNETGGAISAVFRSEAEALAWLLEDRVLG